MAQLMLGKDVNESLADRVREKVQKAENKGVIPGLLIIRVGERESDLSYEKGAVKRCRSFGINVRTAAFPEHVGEEELLAAIHGANEDPAVHGVLLFRPLPGHLNASRIENALTPSKDADGMTDLSLSGVFQGKNLGYPPCTAQAVMEILDYYRIDPKGKRAVVVGRSSVIGRPVAMMLLQRHATVTIAHTRTADLPSVAGEADILVAAAGHAGVVRGTSLREGQVVIDVGINVGPDGRLCGDVAFEEAEPVVAMITPVPRGVGAVTTSVLALHVAEAALKK